MIKDIVHNEDCLTGLKRLGDSCIDCCVTSPPYYGLRDYGTAIWEGGSLECDHKKPNSDTGHIKSSTLEGGKLTNAAQIGGYKDECKKCGAVRQDNQLGLESTPELYVEKMVSVFDQVRRVLKKEGTLWLNLGDSYNGSGGSGGEEYSKRHTQFGKIVEAGARQPPKFLKSIKAKDLIGIPWMVAFALRSAGWYLRQDIIWHKPNPMPESVTDRCTKAHEYIFLLSKSEKYYYDQDAIKTKLIDHSKNDYPFSDGSKKETMTRQRGTTNEYIKAYKHRGEGDKTLTGHSGNFDAAGNLIGDGFANKKSVWTVTTRPYSEAHFATFPERLIVDCIKAGCPEGGIVFDPFMGAFTTALVAKKLNRHYIGYELNGEYIKIGEKRMNKELGMFNR